MFEKEAETVFKKKAYKIAEAKVKAFYKECGWEDYKYMIPEFAEVIAIGMERGVEFGYNKANEWHYVKDGDLPKEEGEYLCAFDFHKRYALDIEFIFINNEGKCYFDNLAWDINKLVAWKEIELPKEIKENG